jgi:membrane protein
VPAVRVRVSAAVSAAIVAGSLWNIAKYGFGFYVRHNVTTHDVYGSLAAVPLFILWLYVSWLLVLLGGQLTFAFHHAATYRPETLDEEPSQWALERSTCRLLLEIAAAFLAGRPAPSREELEETLGLSASHTDLIVSSLSRGGFVRQTEEQGLLPARDLDRITLDDVLRHLREDGAATSLHEDCGHDILEAILRDADQAERQHTGDVTFRALAASLSCGASSRPASRKAEVLGPPEENIETEPPPPKAPRTDVH